jgi:uroporphyrinogen-III synthase
MICLLSCGRSAGLFAEPIDIHPNLREADGIRAIFKRSRLKEPTPHGVIAFEHNGKLSSAQVQIQNLAIQEIIMGSLCDSFHLRHSRPIARETDAKIASIRLHKPRSLLLANHLNCILFAKLNPSPAPIHISRFTSRRSEMASTNFNGIRVLSLESRRAAEAGKLIRTYGGEPLSAPAMREIPMNSDGPVIEFAEALMAGVFNLVIFTTGVGVRALIKTVSEHMDREQFLTALRGVKIAARGPKSSSALREFGVPIAVIAPEPFTWRSLLQAMEKQFGSELNGMNIAVQEYGTSNPELLTALAEKSVSITRVLVYQWAMPEDLQPLREAVIALAHGHVDVVLFMNAGQVAHLFLMAERMGYTEALYEGFRSTLIASIGPSTTEGLSMCRLAPDFEPSQSKMGFLIKEIAENAEKLLGQKRKEASLHVAASAIRPISPLLTSDPAAAIANKAEISGVDFLHEIGSRMAASDPLHTVLNRIVDFACSLIQCDSCFVYVLESDQLVLRASKNPHSDLVDHLGIWLGQGITGWVGWHREPVAIPEKALKDPRFQRFKNLPEDTFEAFLSVPILCRGKLIGVINLQHRKPYYHTEQEVRLLTAAGYLVGAELERARLETENTQLSDRLESRKHIERAKGVLQRDFGLDEEAAYKAMQRESRQRRKSMREIAEAVLLNDDLRKSRWSVVGQAAEDDASAAS